MAKVKSVKFYDFVVHSGKCGSFNARFYDIYGNLILIDLSNTINSNNGVYFENSEYIITASRSFPDETARITSAFHSRSLNKECVIDKLPVNYCNWTANNYYSFDATDWIKFEFKFPKYIGDMQICTSQNNSFLCDSCKCNIEFEDGIIEICNYKSNGIVNTYDNNSVINELYNQDYIDSLFTSVSELSKSKQIYDSKIGYVETLDTNNFRNIPINSIETLKVLYSKPINTILNCVISFDKKQTWKTFDGTNWIEISDTTPENMIVNCMEIEMLNSLDKKKLITGGFMGDLDFKIVMKTNNVNKTPLVTKIYIVYR